MFAMGLAGSKSPSGPVFQFCVTNCALSPIDGVVTTNSARDAGASRIEVSVAELLPLGPAAMGTPSMAMTRMG